MINVRFIWCGYIRSKTAISCPGKIFDEMVMIFFKDV